MATTYDNIEKDSRLTDVKAEEKAKLNETDVQYGNMISQADKYYEDAKNTIGVQDENGNWNEGSWADIQTDLQNQKTEFAIEEINQQKAQAKKDYIKEQSGAYVDWQKQSDPYGVNAERMAAQGFAGSGYSESAQVSMYNTYQNRVAAARESYNLVIQNYNNAITEARIANSSVLAEIALQAMEKGLQLTLEGMQYHNQLLSEQADRKLAITQLYHNKWKDTLDQINTEIAYNEKVREFNESLKWEKEQFNRLHPVTTGGGTSGKTTYKSGGVIKGNTGNSKVTQGLNGSVNISDDSGGAKTGEPNGIANRHGNSWIEIPGHGRFSYQEVLAYVESGQVKETVVDGKLKYTWVKKKVTGANVTPDAKGYAAKQRELFG